MVAAVTPLPLLFWWYDGAQLREDGVGLYFAGGWCSWRYIILSSNVLDIVPLLSAMVVGCNAPRLFDIDHGSSSICLYSSQFSFLDSAIHYFMDM